MVGTGQLPLRACMALILGEVCEAYGCSTKVSLTGGALPVEWPRDGKVRGRSLRLRNES